MRIFVTNKLPEHTSIHWHGQHPAERHGRRRRPDPAGIEPGKTFVYEFVAKHAGTFMYHPHADEMAQMAMGMMGFWITHPKDPAQHAVDRDFVFLLNAYDIDPGSYTPKINTMLDFNLWTFNSRVFPGIDPLVVRQDDRVRIRVGNLTMTNHPIHLHGHDFEVTGTDGGWVPPTARWPEVTTDIAVGQMRAIEFVADNPGDWAFHCHKSHHTMNAMGHDVPTMIGVDHRGVAKKINSLRARLHGDGRQGHGRHGRHGDAAAGQHAADDDGRRPVRRHRDGRHVHHAEGARRPGAQRLQGSRLVPASGGHRRARVDRRRPGGRAAPARAQAPAAGETTVNVRKTGSHKGH